MNPGLPASLRLRVITERAMLVEAEAAAVFLPGLQGLLGIYPGHRPLYVRLGKGILGFRTAEGEESFSVEGGFAEVRPDQVLVMTELSKNESDEPFQG